MSNRELPVTSSSTAFGKRNRWCLFLLDHLAEFATDCGVGRGATT
jgi:hypothetical protein